MERERTNEREGERGVFMLLQKKVVTQVVLNGINYEIMAKRVYIKIYIKA